MAQGALLERFTRRLAETPPEMLAPPAMADQAGVEVGAVAGDVLRGLGLTQPAGWVIALHPQSNDKVVRNLLRLTLIACWLLADPWFRGKDIAERAEEWLRDGLAELAGLTGANAFVEDDDRREELVRLALRALGFTPHGETEAQAQDRLESISSIERKRVIAAAHKANVVARMQRAREEERARKVREEIERKAAEAAAAKGARE